MPPPYSFGALFFVIVTFLKFTWVMPRVLYPTRILPLFPLLVVLPLIVQLTTFKIADFPTFNAVLIPPSPISATLLLTMEFARATVPFLLLIPPPWPIPLPGKQNALLPSIVPLRTVNTARFAIPPPFPLVVELAVTLLSNRNIVPRMPMPMPRPVVPLLRVTTFEINEREPKLATCIPPPVSPGFVVPLRMTRFEMVTELPPRT